MEDSHGSLRPLAANPSHLPPCNFHIVQRYVGMKQGLNRQDNPLHFHTVFAGAH